MVSFYKIGLVCILFLFLVSVSGVCAVDPDNNITDKVSINDANDSFDNSLPNDLDINYSNATFKNTLPINVIEINTNSTLNLKERFKDNESVSHVAKSILDDGYNKLKNYYDIKSQLKQNKPSLNLTIEEIIKIPLNDRTSDLVLNATISYIDHIINYDITQIRGYLKTQLSESNKIKSNAPVGDIAKAIDSNLELKINKLEKLKDCLKSIREYCNSKTNKNISNTTKSSKIIVNNDINTLPIKLMQKDLKSMLGDLNLMTKYLKSIKESLIEIKKALNFKQ